MKNKFDNLDIIEDDDVKALDPKMISLHDMQNIEFYTTMAELGRKHNATIVIHLYIGDHIGKYKAIFVRLQAPKDLSAEAERIQRRLFHTTLLS